MKLRDYQEEAVGAILAAMDEGKKPLGIMPTGAGKTVVFAHILRARSTLGRSVVLARRKELLDQAKSKIERISGLAVGIERGDERTDERSMWKPDCVVSTVQTQVSKCRIGLRLNKFNPHEFATCIYDEAHHAVAKTDGQTLGHYLQNPNLRVAGFTATPKRSDEKALASIFDVRAFVYTIRDAQDNGWLVPVEQYNCILEELDYLPIPPGERDFSDEALAAKMKEEAPCQKVVCAVENFYAGQPTIIYAASVEHARRIAEIWNRKHPNLANVVTGETPTDERSSMLAAFGAGKFPIMCNYGVLTEGYDNPRVANIVIARPTRNQSLYAQMAGRGMRTLEGLVDGIDLADGRIAAIAASPKPHCRILDIHGTTNTLGLVASTDIFDGEIDESVLDCARELVIRGQETNPRKALDRAELEIVKRKAEVEKLKQNRLWQDVKAKASVRYAKVDLWSALGIVPHRETVWDSRESATLSQIALLRRFRFEEHELKDLSRRRASQMIGQCLDRKKKGLCTPRQAVVLKRNGYEPSTMTFTEAKEILDKLSAGWAKKKVTA